MFYVIAAMLLYTFAILVSTSAVRNVNSNLAAGITTLVSAIIPVLIVLPVLTKKAITSHKFGVSMAILAGVLLAFFTLSINRAYVNTKVGIVTPIIFGGAIFLSSILSIFIFKEKIEPLQGVGLFLLLVGFAFIIYAKATA